jgi:hypothetical protein
MSSASLQGTRSTYMNLLYFSLAAMSNLKTRSHGHNLNKAIVATIWDGTDYQNSLHCRKFFWTALLWHKTIAQSC